jgi:hypothetical protein
MNLAFPALLVFLLILPGLLLSYAYRKGFSWRSPVSFSSIPNEITRGVLLAIPLHLVGILLVEKGFGRSVDYGAVLILLLGQAHPESGEGMRALRAVSETPFAIALYFFLLSFGSMGLGYGAHWIVRKHRLDLRWDALRFDNDWYYLFTGEARAFSIPQEERTRERLRTLFEEEQIVYVFIAAVVEQAGSAFLYWGILSDFFFDATGKLDRIILQSAQRRPLSRDRKGEGSKLPLVSEAFYSIRGHYFVLPFSNVRNLNIEYYISTREPPEGEETVEIEL